MELGIIYEDSKKPRISIVDEKCVKIITTNIIE